MLRALGGEDAGGIAQGLVDVVVEFQRGSRRDDIAVLVAKVPEA